MNIKQAINIFLSVFNLALDSDVKDKTPFDRLSIVDYKGENVGQVVLIDRRGFYSIEVLSPEIGVMNGNVMEMCKSYDLSCSINTQMLHSANISYDTVTNNMSIIFNKGIQIINSFSAHKKRETVMRYSFNSGSKDMQLELLDRALVLKDSEDVMFLLETAKGNNENILRGDKKRNIVEYSSTSDASKQAGISKYSDEFKPYSEQTLLEAIFYRTNSVFDPSKTGSISLISGLREHSVQSPSLNYFDNISSLVLSCSTLYNSREVNAIFGYNPNELTTTPKIINRKELSYPGDKRPPKHIAKPE